MTKEEALEMRRYVSKLERYTQGSADVAAALEEARAVLAGLPAAPGDAHPGG